MAIPQRSKLVSVLESKQQIRRSASDYKEFVRDHYDGLPGALTQVTGILTGHEALGGRLIHPEGFDVRGCKSILDAGCGNGRYSVFLLKHADADASITAFDLSEKMLERARNRINNPRVHFLSADITHLPFHDGQFDAVVCGWVIEHLPDPRPGLAELARVTMSGGKLLLMCTEATFLGAWCSRLWHCRTYQRSEMRHAAEDCGWRWDRELWFSRFHRFFGLGGIIVELRRV